MKTLYTLLFVASLNGISSAFGGHLSLLPAREVNSISEAEREFMLSQLSGTWFYKIRNSKKSPASDFSLSLNQDGTFEVKTGPDRFHSSYEGFWQLSCDGQYLLLHTRVLIDTREHFVAEKIHLKSVDFEDMVIGAQILPRVLSAYGGKNFLYLSKIKAPC